MCQQFIICDMCISYLLLIFQNGWTPLMITVENQNIEMITVNMAMCKLLIENGAVQSINIPNMVNI